jgi:bacillopeptidase F
VTPPALAHVPPPDPAASQLPLSVKVTAFDNLALDSVAVEWRKTGGPPVTTTVAAAGDGPYTFAIGAGAVYGDVVTYRFLAVDKALGKNRTVLPAAPAPYALLVGGNYAESFEAGEAGYTHSNVGATFQDQWHLESGHNHTLGGTTAWKCGSVGPGTYRAGLDAGLVSAPIAIGTGAHLRFWHDYDAEPGETPAEAYDGALVELSVNNGATWTQIAPVGGYPAVILPGSNHPLPAGTPVWSGSSGGFVQADFDLAAYAGQLARVRWRFASDGFVELGGWYVDDVTLTNVGGQPVEVPIERVPAFALGAPVPNPSVGPASIAYRLPVAQHVRIALYDVRGRLVRTLFDGPREAGAFAADWDGRMEDGGTASAGLYFVRLAGSVSGTREGRLIRLP